jgi:TonB-linked SusC/RagA family outer membrane protein
MLKKALLLLAILIAGMGVGRANSQQPAFSISGNVVDTSGRPIVGAFVGIAGATGGGTITDDSGLFSLNVTEGATIEVSYIGYTTQRIEIGERRQFTITLMEDLLMVDQVVVIAYGEQKRSAFTGSASVLSAEAIALRPVTSVMGAIEGAIPGVQIQRSSSAPDAGVSLRIRGASSINAGSSPMIVVDGAPYGGSLNNINPDDVESMTVLKDAASTAIYGARGGNGVVLITTKKANRQNRAGVSFNARVTLSQLRESDLYDVITSPGEFYEEYYRAVYNYKLEQTGNPYRANLEANAQFPLPRDKGGLGYVVYTVPENEQLIGINGRLNPAATLGRITTGKDGKKYLLRPDDWLKESFRMGVRQDYNVSMRGGSESFDLLASLGYTNDTGISAPTSYQRYTGRLNSNFRPYRWLTFRGSLDMARSTSNHAYDNSDNSNNIFSNVNQMAPIYPIYIRDENGNIVYDDNGKVYDYGTGDYSDGIERTIRPGSNRLQEALIQTNRTLSMNVGAQAAFDVKFTPWLTATANVSYMARERRSNQTNQPFYGSSNPGGRVSVIASKFESLNMQQLLNFSKSFGRHNVSATLLHEYDTHNTYSVSGNRTLMSNYFQNQELAGAVSLGTNNSYKSGYQGEGFGGRVFYDLGSTYHFDASYRRDGSTKFHPDHRWGNFFSMGGAWIISNEKFFKASWVDMLKVKLSYGRQGNDSIGDYRYDDRYQILPVGDEVGFLFDGKGNKSITWEARSAVNFGIETQLFGGRLSGTIEYYRNKTTDMLSNVSMPVSIGYASYTANVGSMRNSGIEFDIEGYIVRNANFHVSLNVNGAIGNAKVLTLVEGRTRQRIYDLNGNKIANGYSSGSYFYGEGLEYRTWYLKKFAGVNEQGRPMWYMFDEETKEISTTTTYSSASEFACGSSQPKLLGGFGGSVGWKALSLSFNFSYRLGGYAYDGGYAELMSPPNSDKTGFNFHRDIAGSWTPQNPSNTLPRWQYNDKEFTSASDRWLTKADYLNLQNVTLSYALPNRMISKMGMKGLTVSAGVDDIFFWSARKGFVPNRDFDGDLGIGYYPNTRRFMMGVKIDF